MLLSFSVPSMRPLIEAGVRQWEHETHNRGTAVTGRVKRQTIRPRGPRARGILQQAEPGSGFIPYALHLWWKSRTPEKAFLGEVSRARAFPLLIESGFAGGDPDAPIARITGPEGWRDGASELFWAPVDGVVDGATSTDPFVQETWRDGFDTPNAFCEFFIPRPGEVFDGILLRW